MKILAMDTSGGFCSAAIMENKRALGQIWLSSSNHAVTLMPIIDTLLTQTGLSLSDIDYIAFVSGPGSFTGLKIGAACAKALAHSRNIPVIEVPALDALAYNILTEGIVIPILDAKRNQVYTAYFSVENSGLKLLSDYLATDIQKVLERAKELGNAVFVGTDIYAEEITAAGFTMAPPHLNRIQSTSAGALAFNLLDKAKAYHRVEVFYLRKPQALREKNQIEIDFFKKEEFEQIYQIELSCFPSPWSEDSMVQSLENPDNIFLTAKKAGVLIGFICMDRILDEGHITNLAVHPSHRQEGAASALLKKLSDLSLEKGIGSITLEVRVNNTAARNLYEKHGFVAEGIRKNYYPDTKEDALIMWKRTHKAI